jgi:hypothetical protein
MASQWHNFSRCCFTWLLLMSVAWPSSGRAEEIVVAPGTKSLVPLLAKAKAGTTLVLPVGTFPGGLTLPPGVSLRGAGYAKTTLDAGTNAAGLALKGGEGSRIEDLSIETKGIAAIVVADARNVEIRRVRIRGGALGVQWANVEGGRVENCIVADSLVGLSFQRVRAAVVVNCTFAGNASVGLSFSDAENITAFNNLVADAGTGIVINGKHDGLAVDYNLYRSLTAGKTDGQIARVTVPQWRDLMKGLDAHSVALRVRFASPDGGDYRPVSVLEWAPWRATTSDWGVAELAGHKAPATDIDGKPRVGAFDLGAYEAPEVAAPKPDAEFRIADEEGTKSAGVFHSDGTLVRYLFHDLPLKKGTYGVLLTNRTQLGEAVPAGEYEIRVVESRLSWKYRRITGNAGVDSQRYNTDEAHVMRVAFAPDGSLLMGTGWNERNENLRSRNLQTGQANWVFNGNEETRGLCVSGGVVYFLRPSGIKDTYKLSRLDGRTGKLIPWDNPKQELQPLADANLNGMDELGGTLYVADTKNNKIYRASTEKPKFAEPIDCPSPSQPAADRKRKIVWVLSGLDKLLALSPTGERIAECTSVRSPVGLAVHGDRLAIASAATGKIHFFDCSNPKELRPLRTIGRGDGPYGPLVPDRFHFQTGPYNEARPVSLALDESERIALKDVSGRVVVLTASGESQYASISQFGNQPTLALFGDDERVRAFDHRGRFSWWIDAKAGRWQPDAYWGLPPNTAQGDCIVGYFADGGKKYGIVRADWREPGEKNPHGSLLIVRFEKHIGRPVLLYTPAKNGMWVVRRDTNKDGLIDEKDGPGFPVLNTAGQPLRWPMVARWMFAEPDGNGDFRTMTGIGPDGVGFVWKRKGLDAHGVPIYQFPPESLLRVKQPTVASAYDYSKTEDVRNQSESRTTKDGRLLATFQFRHGPNTSLSNSGGIDLALFERDGHMRWLRPLNDYAPIQGVKRMGKAFLTSWGHQAEWIGLEENGLGLGRLGFPSEAYWTGMWVDHPGQYLTFDGNDGKVHVLVGDYMVNGTHWLTLDHTDDYKQARFPFKLDAEAARALAFRPVRPFDLLGKSAAPKVVIRRLNAPLKIDGDLNKWRAAGITPQVLMLPVTAYGAIDGPKDASAVVRLAYEGNNLYVQVLRFDDVVTFHQPVSKSHLQDTFEIMLNGFFDGFQWSVSNYTDAAPAMVRRRFFYGKLEDRTPAEHAPRSVRVLDNAKDIPERKLIEAVHGVDMSDCKVIVTEFKLPIDKTTYRGSEESLFSVKPGATFWLGLMLCDNDMPGTDVQDYLVWPSSYGTFQPKEDGALAIFER